MKKYNLLHKIIFVVLTISMTFSIITGCKKNTSSANPTQENSTTSSNQGKNSDDMKQKITDTINSLVSAGTINSDQGNKIIENLTTRSNNPKGGKKQTDSNSNNANNNTTNNNDNNANKNQNPQNNKQGRQNFNPLSSLVDDKTITQEQADAVMNKLRENGAFGSRQNKNDPNSKAASN